MTLRYIFLFLILLAFKPSSALSQYSATIVDTVNLRLNPSTRAKIIQKVNAKEKVKVITSTSYREAKWIEKERVEKPWVNIQLKDGTKGWVYGFYLKTKDSKLVKVDKLTKEQLALLKPRERTIVPRTFKRNFRKNHNELADIAYPQNAQLSIENDSLMGWVGKYEVVGRDDYERIYGKILRALRFKNITDAVEERYNLPSGILLAMIIQESSGEPLLLNGQDDGGAGLSHMQPSVAQEFSLKPLNDASGLVNKAHGKELRELITNIQEYIAPIMMVDDRLNWLKNIDGVGRMMATYMSAGANAKYGGELESMIARYSGARNFKQYFQNIDFYMTLLNNDLTYHIIKDQFQRDNQNLIINGKANPNYTFIDYLAAYWEFNEALFQLDKYRTLIHYNPYHSYKVLLNLPEKWQQFR